MTSIALLLDVDGTLLDFAPHPDAVVVETSLLELLSRLHAAAGGALALVSGRSIATLDRLFAPLRLPAVGLHGIELRAVADSRVDRPSAVVPPPHLVDAIERALERHPTAFAEHKGPAIAIHHRLMPDTAGMLQRELADACATAGGQWGVMRGRQVLEIKPTGVSKAGGCDRLLARPEFAGRHAIAFGDDTTDLDMFEAVRRHGGTTISVGPRIARAGHYRLPAPREAIVLLERILARLEAGGTAQQVLAVVRAMARPA